MITFLRLLLLLAPIMGKHRVMCQPSSFNLTDLLDGTSGVVYNGAQALDYAGLAVSSGGDVNGDGIDDFIVSAPFADPNDVTNAGQVYVVFGTTATALLVPSFDLSELNGTNGFTINGTRMDDGFSTLASGCDVNSDGIDDFVIGTPLEDPNRISSGQVHVFYGSNSTWPSSLKLTDLNGTNGFTINGMDRNDYTGRSVSCSGDINGDGVDDIVMGAPGVYDNPNTNSAGRVFALWGSREQVPSPIDLTTDLNGTSGVVLNGFADSSHAGWSVSSASDVNGDGVNDIIIGSPYIDLNGSNRTGQVHVVFGTNGTWTSPFDLSDLNGTNGFTLNGTDEDDTTGYSVTGGDLNGDGIDDLVIAAHAHFGNASGKVYVVFGSNDGTWESSFNLSQLNGTNGITFHGIDEDDETGWSVSAGGDVNGDGVIDLVIGAPLADPGGDARGEVFVVYGSNGTWASPFNLSNLDGSNGFVLNGINNFDRAGSSVSTGGDINGDGINDLVIGAARGDPNRRNSGEVYVIFGAAQTPAPTHAPSTQAPTTTLPSTQGPSSTALPSTQAPATPLPTTLAPTTSQAPSTPLPTTQGPSSTALPSTQAPTTSLPTTVAPTTSQAPSTPLPTSEGPATPLPTNQAPSTPLPTSQAPSPASTPLPWTQAPTTTLPNTDSPTTDMPSTEEPAPECYVRRCCEEECCGKGTSWAPDKGCYKDPTSNGWDGTYTHDTSTCRLRACCEGYCCGQGTWYSSAEASCVPL